MGLLDSFRPRKALPTSRPQEPAKPNGSTSLILDSSKSLEERAGSVGLEKIDVPKNVDYDAQTCVMDDGVLYHFIVQRHSARTKVDAENGLLLDVKDPEKGIPGAAKFSPLTYEPRRLNSSATTFSALIYYIKPEQAK